MLNPSLLLELKSTLESAAFLVSKPAPREAHSLILKALVLLSRFEDFQDAHAPETSRGIGSPQPTDAKSHTNDTESEREVKKVQRRLKLWSGRPQQFNAQILIAYLKLERAGVDPVTEQRLRSALPSSFPFSTNFVQMKIIADRNHGKVFEILDDRISIWGPVEDSVREFEKRVFASSS